MNKLVAFDLDGTLLNKKGKLSERNKEALMQAMHHGVKICIATGRAFDSIPKELLEFPGIAYAITSNGAAIYKIDGKKCLRTLVLDEKSVDTILTVTKDTPVVYEAFVRGVAYGCREYVEDPVRYGASEAAVSYIQSTRNKVDDIKAFMIKHRQELDSIDVVVNSEELKKELMEKIGKADSDLYITSSVKQLIELSHAQGGKGRGLQFLAEYLGYDQKDVIAFGDADNDIDMLQYAGCGVAMANASQGLLEVADMVTTHHDENGVADAFCRLFAFM